MNVLTQRFDEIIEDVLNGVGILSISDEDDGECTTVIGDIEEELTHYLEIFELICERAEFTISGININRDEDSYIIHFDEDKYIRVN